MSEWQPIPPGGFRIPPFLPHHPTPRQAIFLGLHQVAEAMYGGAAGGGKSDALLMDAMQYWDVPGYSALIIRRTFPDLARPGAIMDRAKQWLLPVGIPWHEGQHTFTFQSGARLSFGYLTSERDRYSYQSAEYQYVGFDEGTQFRENEYTYLASRNRRPSELDPTSLLARVPLRMRMATNPGNIGHEWVKRRFLPYARPDGEVVYPRNESGEIRAFVRALLTDNPFLDADSYRRNLQELDPVTRAQYLNGDWEARPPGEMFDSGKLELCYWDQGDSCWRALSADGTSSRVLSVTRWVRFWDFASTRKRHAGQDPDWTVGALLGRTAQNEIVVADIVRFRDKPAEVEERVVQTARADREQWDSRTVRMEVEPGSSGQFTKDRFARALLGYDFGGIRSTGPKTERARPLAAAVGSGLVYVPTGAPWLTPYMGELDAFPYGEHDDQVDASSGAFSFLAETYVAASGTIEPEKERSSSPYAAARRGASPYAAQRRGGVR